LKDALSSVLHRYLYLHFLVGGYWRYHSTQFGAVSRDFVQKYTPEHTRCIRGSVCRQRQSSGVQLNYEAPYMPTDGTHDTTNTYRASDDKNSCVIIPPNRRRSLHGTQPRMDDVQRRPPRLNINSFALMPP